MAIDNSDAARRQREIDWLHDSLQTNQRRAVELEREIVKLKRQVQVMETFADTDNVEARDNMAMVYDVGTGENVLDPRIGSDER